MSHRDLSQPSFIDAMVSGYGKVGGFLDRIEQNGGGSWTAWPGAVGRITRSNPGRGS